MSEPKSFFDQVWEYSMVLPGTPFTVRGHSRGSERSGFQIPELKLYFDCGIHRHGRAKYLFITHGHTDHSGQLPTFVSGIRVNGLDPPEMYAPLEVVDLFQNYLEASFRMKRANRHIRGTYRVRGCAHGDVIPLDKQGYFVRAYKLFHNVPTRGYGLCQSRKKLKPAFKELSGPEIGKLRKEGVTVTDLVTYKIFAYVCDTNITVFQHSPELLSYQYLMVECTFFCDESMKTMGEHIHWKQLKPYVLANPNTTFILIHFSMRYTVEEIKTFFAKEEMKNIIIWTN